MKKAISLFLVLVLCLSLCACGNENSIDKSEQASSTTNTQSDSAETPSTKSTQGSDDTLNTENEHYIHPRLSEMCGSWINNRTETDDFNPCLTLTINEDHTCVVDDVTYSWDYSPYTTDERLVLYIFNGEECLIDAVLEADGALLVCHHEKMGEANWRRAEDATS